MKLKRIRYDGETWDFSEYFDYIRSVSDTMPDALREYSVDFESYALHGTKTLHDSRMLSAVLEKKYNKSFTNVALAVELTFIDQLFEGRITLRYEDVVSYVFKEADISSNRHADVLVHEFSSVAPDLFRHRIIFDHEGEVELEFRDFSYMRNRIM